MALHTSRFIYPTLKAVKIINAWFDTYMLIQTVNRKEFEERTFPHAYNAVVFQKDGHYYARDDNGNTICIDSATACIQEAINYVNNVGGGIVHIRRGSYNISQSITMLSGVIVEGEGYLMNLGEPYPPEVELPVSGTIINANYVDAFTGSNITSGGIRDLLINKPARGIVFGEPNKLGAAFFHIKNVMVFAPSIRGIEVTNFQYLRIDQLYILRVPDGANNVAPGAWFKNQHNNWDGGNSVFVDIFVRGGAQADGVITFESIDHALNFIEVIRPQVNAWNSNGVGANIKLVNNYTHGTSLKGINIYGGDFEGGAQYAVKLLGATMNYINITFEDATYSVYLGKSSTNQISYGNIITGVVRSIYNDTSWQNYVISSYLNFKLDAGGIYGLVFGNNPVNGLTRPVLMVGPRGIYFDDIYSIREPGQNFGIATITAGSSAVNVSHGMGCTPNTVIVTPLGQPSGYVWVSDITSTDFKINISTVPSENLPIAWLARC